MEASRRKINQIDEKYKDLVFVIFKKYIFQVYKNETPREAINKLHGLKEREIDL
jgi:hypothetical protein